MDPEPGQDWTGSTTQETGTFTVVKKLWARMFVKYGSVAQFFKGAIFFPYIWRGGVRIKWRVGRGGALDDKNSFISPAPFHVIVVDRDVESSQTA